MGDERGNKSLLSHMHDDLHILSHSLTCLDVPYTDNYHRANGTRRSWVSADQPETGDSPEKEMPEEVSWIRPRPHQLGQSAGGTYVSPIIGGKMFVTVGTPKPRPPNLDYSHIKSETSHTCVGIEYSGTCDFLVHA